jgi:putative oxidoreductase
VTLRFLSTHRRAVDALNELDWLPNLLLRLTVGFMFFSGAVDKLGDVGKFTAMFVSLGIPAAPVIAPATAVLELFGGVALMLGLATRLVSLVLAGDMVPGAVAFPEQPVLRLGVATGRAVVMAAMCRRRQGQSRRGD